MEKLKLGLIGCGGMMKNHAKGISTLDCVEITAVCDIDRTLAEDVASVLNSPYVTTDYKTMTDYVDAVLVVLPHHLHFPCGMYFARAGKHIMMEKPLCNTEEECIKLIETCEEMGVTLMCAYPVRYWKGIQKLKELVDSGEYGKIMQMSVWTEQLTIYDEQHWGSTAALGGGQFFSHGCHYVDLLLWFCGKPVSGNHFGTTVGTPWLLGEGTSVLTMKFENGALGYHGATWGSRGTKMGTNFQIIMEKGTLEFEIRSGEVRVYDTFREHKPGETDEDSHKYRVVWKRDGALTKETQHEVAHFADCVRTGKKPMTDGYSALKGLQIIWKLYDCEKFGQIADLRGMGLED